MARRGSKGGEGHAWQPPRQFNEAPPTAKAPHFGTTHKSDKFSSDRKQTGLGGFVGKPKGASIR